MSKKDSQNFKTQKKIQNKLINNMKTNKKQNDTGKKKMDLKQKLQKFKKDSDL